MPAKILEILRTSSLYIKPYQIRQNIECRLVEYPVHYYYVHINMCSTVGHSPLLPSLELVGFKLMESVPGYHQPYRH